MRDRYGRNAWGQQLLMARRLVEAGVEIVTTELTGPLCGRVQNWDDHAVNHHVFDALKYRAPFFDQAVTALDRGRLRPRAGPAGAGRRDRRVRADAEDLATSPAAAAAWPAGRPARCSRAATTGRGPTRCSGPAAASRTGRVIGATDRRGEDVVDRRVGPQDFLATIYHHLGIDYEKVTLPDFTGRPIHIVQDGKAIPELTAG